MTAQPTETADPKPSTALAMSTSPAKAALVVHDDSSFANLLDTGRFEHMWRVAKVFSASGMVPKHFQNKPEACFVAVQMAVRLEVDPFMFMQNTYLSPDGKPAMEGKLAIALINARGPFIAGINFEFSGEGDDYGCTAFGIHKGDGKRRELRVDIALAKSEGWWSRNKKWQSITDQMLRYRSGAWLGKAICPEVLMGMQTADEVEDTGTLRAGVDGVYQPSALPPRPTRADVAAATDSTDEAAAAAHRELDRQAAAAINGTVATEDAEIVDAETGEVTAPTDTLKPAALSVLPPLRADKNWDAWKNDALEVVASIPPQAFPEVEAELAGIAGIPNIHHVAIVKAMKARK